MKFKISLRRRTTIKKKKFYEFIEFSDEEILKGREHTFDNPLFLYKNFEYFALYRDKEDETILIIIWLHSFDKFREVKEK